MVQITSTRHAGVVVSIVAVQTHSSAPVGRGPRRRRPRARRAAGRRRRRAGHRRPARRAARRPGARPDLHRPAVPADQQRGQPGLHLDGDRHRAGAAVRRRRLGPGRLRRRTAARWWPAPPATGPTSWPRASSPRASTSSCRAAASAAPPPRRGCRSEFFAAPEPETAAERVQVVSVSTPTRADKRRLQSLGLDLTEHGTARSVDVVVRGAADARRLRDAGLRYTVKVPDLAARAAANRRADLRYDAATAALGAAERAHGVPAAVRLRAGDEAADDPLPGAGPAADAARAHHRGPRRRGHRDHRGRGEDRRRQAGLPQHRRPPRPRVALRRARHGVRLRPASAATAAAGALRRTIAGDPHDPRPGGQPGRVLDLAGGAARSAATSAPSTTSSSGRTAGRPTRRRRTAAAPAAPTRPARTAAPTSTATTAASGAARARARSGSTTPSAAPRRSPSRRRATSGSWSPPGRSSRWSPTTRTPAWCCGRRASSRPGRRWRSRCTRRSARG